MKLEIEEPTVREGSMGDEVTSHPAFAQLSVSRVSGRTNLYGSDFSHNSYVVVRIHPSELHRSLSRDSHFAGVRPIAEVAMSEAQWATFVSSFNMGGVPCTIQQFNGERLPQLPDPKSRADQFGAEMQEDFTEALAALDELRAAVADNTTGLSKKKQDAILGYVHNAKAKLNSSAPFVADQFGKHMQAEKERAKVEIHGYANQLFQRAGVTALAGSGPLALEDKTDA
jgi:hypothetical protein